MTQFMPDYDRAWQALTGRDDEWSGCAERVTVERIVSLIDAVRADQAEKDAQIAERQQYARGMKNPMDVDWTGDARARAIAAVIRAAGQSAEFKPDAVRLNDTAEDSSPVDQSPRGGLRT